MSPYSYRNSLRLSEYHRHKKQRAGFSEMLELQEICSRVARHICLEKDVIQGALWGSRMRGRTKRCGWTTSQIGLTCISRLLRATYSRSEWRTIGDNAAGTVPRTAEDKTGVSCLWQCLLGDWKSRWHVDRYLAPRTTVNCVSCAMSVLEFPDVSKL